MKRETHASIYRNGVHARRSLARALQHGRKRKEQRRQELLDFIRQKEDRPRLVLKKKKPRKHLALPPILSLTHAYDEVIQFIEAFKHVALEQRRPVQLDFTSVKSVSPAAALVLVSELDRWRRCFGFKPVVIDLDLWDPNVRRLLGEMGFFDVLDVQNLPEAVEATGGESGTDMVFIRFRSRRKAVGEEAVAVREDLENSVGRMVPNKRSLFRAVSEAMTNALQHAYPDYMKNHRRIQYRRWWISGSFQRSTKKLQVLFFDQGVGIPKTLPRKHSWEKILGVFDKLGLARDDATLIRAAIELGRSATDQPHRGKGLEEIQRFVDGFPDGKLRILSGAGEYLYTNGAEPKLRNHSRSIGGTLIQWEIGL